MWRPSGSRRSNIRKPVPSQKPTIKFNTNGDGEMQPPEVRLSDRITNVGDKMGDLSCARDAVLKIGLLRRSPHDVVCSDF
jgi:hypothetical protein